MEGAVEEGAFNTFAFGKCVREHLQVRSFNTLASGKCVHEHLQVCHINIYHFQILYLHFNLDNLNYHLK